MRTYRLVLLLALLLSATAGATDLRHFDDAPLHAVQFVDGKEGWAVGDEGVVWHSIDGGESWERQPTGVRASLRSLHFINPFVGWIAGREELPLGGGSAGVLLYTNDGGEHWHRVTLNSMPGLEQVRFVDSKVGYALGDGSDLFPSGVFVTRDAGRSWAPVDGPRTAGWRGAEFSGPDQGALVGNWNRLGTVRNGRLALTSDDSLGGRNLRGVYFAKGPEGLGVAVGQGGLLLLSKNGGGSWGSPDLLLPPEVLACWDLHAVHGAGTHVWAAGRPGSALLHSRDGGKSWEVQSTGQPLPVSGLYFHDKKHGWAVGELGTILGTADGGKTWTVRRQGGKRTPLMLIHTRAAGVPVEAVARLGGDEGYLAAALRVCCADSATAPPARAGEDARLTAAMRQLGGAAAETLWQFGVPAHLSADSDALVKHWDGLQDGQASQQILRQLVLALRVWRPEVIVTDLPDPKAGPPLDAAIAMLVREAFDKAADPKAFPEQLGHLGLREWKPAKLYALTPEGGRAEVSFDLTEVRARLQGSVRDFAAGAASLLAESPVVLPRRRAYRLLASHTAGAERHTALMEGVKDVDVGDGRRKAVAVDELTDELRAAIRVRQTLSNIAEKPVQGLTDPDRLLASVGPMLQKMPEAHAAAAAHAVASQFARQGQWVLAREIYLSMVHRYPAHPLTADALRWLIRHNSSSETRRRHELGQFLVTRSLVGARPPRAGEDEPAEPKRKGLDTTRLEFKTPDGQGTWDGIHDGMMMRDHGETRRWHQGALALEPKLSGFGPLLAQDPCMQFCMHAARRNLGDFETSRQWLTEFVARQPAGPWRDAAAAELWLVNRQGVPPKPILGCREAEARPFLDGKFDDPCWQGFEPLALKDAAGQTGKDCPTKVRLTYDRDFLYLALRCEHPTADHVEPTRGRKRDEELKRHDRVSLLLDLDRDYATCFHFQVDQRGCVREECWGDVTWNPKWYVAVHSEASAWQIEAAIPLSALTGDAITGGRTWACNVVRTVPGRGVQAWSLPAGVPEEDARLEGMGLLTFRVDTRQEVQGTPRPPAAPMKRVP